MRGQRDKVTFSPRGVAASFIIVMAALLFSCGLPTSEYLYPPSQFLSSGSSLIRLIHETSNIDYSDIADLFKGYEIYYRIFYNSSDATTSYNTLTSLDESDSFASSTIETVADAQGYHVLIDGDTSKAALISVSNNDYTYFALNLKPSEPWSISSDDATYTPFINIVRNKTDSTTADFCDSSEYSSDDHDYEGNRISSGDTLYIVFFAVSYGTSSSLNDIYSDPKILEPIAYTPGS